MHRRERVLLTLALVLSAALIAFICFRPTGTIDLWWTLKAGDYIRTEGDVPRTTLWTIESISGLPYICHGWIAALVYSSVAHAFGLDAVPAVPTLVALAVFASLVALGRRLGASWLLAVAIADLALWVVILRMICRAEVFGYLFFVLALLAIAAFARTRRPRTLVWILPLAVLWTNSHGSVLILLGLLPIAALGLALEDWRRSGFRRDAALGCLFSRGPGLLLATGLLAATATLANPYGVAWLRSTLDQSTSSLWGQSIEEWRSLYSRGLLPARFVVPASLVGVALLTGFRRLSFVSCLLALFLAALALSANRHLPFFGIGAAFVLGEYAAGLELDRRGRTAAAAALVALLVAASAFSVASLGFGNRRLSRNPSPWISERGLAFIRHNVRGNVLNRWQLGGLLIYFTYPQIRVSIDSRADPYPADYFRSYQRAIYGSARQTLAFVDRYAIDHIIIDRATFDSDFRRKLDGLKGFRVAFADERTVVLSRESAGTAAPPALAR